MAVANLKTLLSAGGGGSFTYKTGQSYSTVNSMGIGGVSTGALDVSTATDVISLTGKWAVPLINLLCAASGTGTMTATLTVDGVQLISSASVGTNQFVNLWGQAASSTFSTAQHPVLTCNSSMTLTIQRSTPDVVTTNYVALAIE
jgi:hypothetical protein